MSAADLRALPRGGGRVVGLRPRPAAAGGLAEIGFGCSRIGSLGNPAGPRESAALLECALGAGVALFDTADVYGQGDSEVALGRLLKGRRDAGFVVTKVGRTFSAKMRLLRPLKPLLRPALARSAALRAAVVGRRDGVMATDFDPGRIALAVADSLRRLRFERVDALLLHGPTAAELRDPGLVDCLLQMRRNGWVDRFGVACDDVASLEASFALEGAAMVEIAPDLLDRALSLRAEAVQAGRGTVSILLREVIRHRGALSPVEAVRAAASRPGVAAVVVGTGSATHLLELLAPSGALSGPAAPASRIL